MQQTIPQVEGGRLYQLATEAEPIVVGTPAWYDWLEHNTAFLFADDAGTFTARKNGTAPHNLDWSASRSRGGRLHHVSLGSTRSLTLSRLHAAAQILAGEQAPAEPTRVSAAHPAASLQSVAETGPQFGPPRSLLRTKLYRPPLSCDLIFRDRLIDRLNAGLSGKVTLLCTPAGFGKSTLLTQWLQVAGRPAAWLSLDDHDEEPAVFVHAFTAALRTLFPDACPATASLLATGNFPSVEQVAILLLNELADLPASVILVLDDYHLIRTSEVHALLALVIEHLPPSLHLALASRSDPPLPLARWRAKGVLHDLRGADLRFTLEETHALLEHIVGSARAQATAEALLQRTEGWIALLRLAALSLRNAADPAAFLQRLASYADSAISSYLVEEILAQQAPAVQDFLVRTSLLKQFNAGLCAATLDSDAPYDQLQAILSWLEHANVFIIPLDERQGWYRYHPLFKQLLEQRLREYSSPAALARLHRRASAWYAGQGLIEDAIEHALAAGDIPGVARLVEAQFLRAFEREQLAQMERWLRLVPEEQIQGSPGLLVARAWIMQARGRLMDLPSLLKRAEQLLETDCSDTSDADDSQARFLRAFIATSWSLFQFFTGQAEASLESARTALEWLPRSEGLIAITALRSLVWSSQATGQETVALFELNKTLQEQSAHLNKILNLLFTQAVVYLTAGKLPQVELTARHLLRLTPHADYVLSQSYAHWALGIVYYEWNQLDTAIYHFSAVTANQHHAHFWVVRDAICGLALAYQAQGFETQARETARALLELVQEQNNMHELMVAYTFQAQLALLRDEVEAAEQWLELAGEQAVWGPMLFLEDEPITRARLLLARGDELSVAQGQALLTRLLQHVEALHSTRKTIQVLALQAWAYEQHGRMAEALAALERSLALARPGGFIRTFADLPAVARVVQELRSRRKAQRANDKNLEAYLQRLLVAMRAGPSQVGAEAGRMGHEGLEPLTGREWQILRLLDKELTNKEIARELVVTPGTVKVHTNSIYRKLSVTNRRGAIALAKALGLLAVK